MKRIICRIGSTALLVTLLTVGWQAVFTPHTAAADCDGPGEIKCEAHESRGHDRFCPEIWWFFKYCYEVIYYRTPEPEICTAPGVPGHWECEDDDDDDDDDDDGS